MINEVYVEHLNYQQAQLNFLQSQINPHFLSNCLNFIYQMNKGGRIEGAADMALYLGRYFRYATKSDKDIVTIKEEIDNIENYIRIQKMRYPEKIDYHIDISDKIMNLKVPRLVIQPVVENSIIHGIEAIDRPGKIEIYTEEDNQVYTIIVEDNGPGIEEEELKEIRMGLNETEEQEDMGYGILNPHLRLRLKFGDNAGLVIENRKVTGTRVFIKKKKKEEG